MSANNASFHGSKRVALLAREGAARDKLRQTLGEIGADVVLEADPLHAEPASLTAAAVQVALVALEPAVEDALPALDEALRHAGIATIFDDAELAAQREGWDAQRWARHLSAKLHGHGNVLPPGHEGDTASPVVAQPSVAAAAMEAAPEPPPLPSFGELSLAEIEPVVEEAPAIEKFSFEDTPAPAAAAYEFADEPAAWTPPAQAPGELIDGFGTLSLDEDTPDEALPRAVAAPSMSEPPPLPPELPPVPALPKFDFGNLSLEGDDATAPAAATGSDVAQGALLLFAGIGGPDAVRRVLAELPDSFPQPVLLHLRLDGGRYDNLVRQLERISPMPVALAAAGQPALAGHVYVVPDEVAARAVAGGVRFEAGQTDVPALLRNLPARRTAALLLSGSDPAHVGVALEMAALGAYVAGQSPQGCYDPAASKALMLRGGITGAPAELAAGVIEHSY